MQTPNVFPKRTPVLANHQVSGAESGGFEFKGKSPIASAPQAGSNEKQFDQAAGLWEEKAGIGRSGSFALTHFTKNKR